MSEPIVRPFTEPDIPGLTALLHPIFNYSERRMKHGFSNPDRYTDSVIYPPGFVLDLEGRGVGYADSYRREVYAGQRPYTALIRGSFYIETPYRAYLPLLLNEIHHQPNIDLFLINSSNQYSSKINKIARFKTGPETCAQNRFRLFSRSDALLYASSRSKKLRRIPFFLRWTAAKLAGICWTFGKIFKPDRLPKERTGLTSRRIEQISDSVFGPFWEKLLAGNHGLLTSRSPDILRWTFQSDLDSGRKVMLGRFKGEELQGEITIWIKREKDGTKRVRVVDWIALDRNEDVLADLLRDAVLYVRHHKLGFILQVTGFPEQIQPLIADYLPLKKSKSNCFYIKTKNKDILALLPDSWFYGPYDGDSAWC